MIDNFNASKETPTGEFVDIKKFIGVGSIQVRAINPNNDKLRSFGWTVPNGADEPSYVITNTDGKKSARIRFLVTIHDFDDKPVVAMDFWVRPEVFLNKDNTKAKIIDSFTRTAWGTKQEIKEHKIPQYSKGPAKISKDYKLCHSGEEELISFLHKLLCVTPVQQWSKTLGRYVNTKNPGHLTIDNWADLCNGNVSEIAEYIAEQPNNKVKGVFGVRITEDNKVYQTFLPTCFIGNGALPDKVTGEYEAARKAIDRYNAAHPNTTCVFSATPIKEWSMSATDVRDNAENLPDFNDPSYTTPQEDDLPFSTDDPF